MVSCKTTLIAGNRATSSIVVVALETLTGSFTRSIGLSQNRHTSLRDRLKSYSSPLLLKLIFMLTRWLATRVFSSLQSLNMMPMLTRWQVIKKRTMITHNVLIAIQIAIISAQSNRLSQNRRSLLNLNQVSLFRCTMT